MNRNTTVSLMMTIRLLKLADSEMPMISRMVISATMIIAGTLSTAPVLDHPSVKSRQTLIPASGGAVWVYGAEVYWGGMTMPTSLRNDTTYPDQPTATVDAAKRYSRIRSQPMIHATNSPSVA